jgi:hypothetical protein
MRFVRLRCYVLFLPQPHYVFCTCLINICFRNNNCNEIYFVDSVEGCQLLTMLVEQMCRAFDSSVLIDDPISLKRLVHFTHCLLKILYNMISFCKSFDSNMILTSDQHYKIWYTLYKTLTKFGFWNRRSKTSDHWALFYTIGINEWGIDVCTDRKPWVMTIEKLPVSFVPKRGNLCFCEWRSTWRAMSSSWRSLGPIKVSRKIAASWRPPIIDVQRPVEQNLMANQFIFDSKFFIRLGPFRPT